MRESESRRRESKEEGEEVRDARERGKEEGG